jgi:ribosomal protein S18 acetylase RimI-like enzyme
MATEEVKRMIDKATANDLLFIEAVTQQNMLEHYARHAKAWDDAVFANSIQATENLIVRIAGKPVAAMRYTLSETYLYINDLQVQKDHQQQGHGTALLLHAFDLAKQHALGKVRLCVFKTNTAFEYYQRFGFLHVGEQGHLFRMEKSFV